MDIINLFHNKELYKQAVTLSHHGKPGPYERLEFLGDRVLGIIVADMLYRAFPKEREGSLARRFVSMVREEALASVAKQWGLQGQLITTESELRHNESVLADVCEAILGGLYLDSGLEAVRTFMDPFWRPMLHVGQEAPKDFKSALQEWSQKNGHELPIYTLLNKEGKQHAPVFHVRVEVTGVGFADAEGTSKKAAQIQAAGLMLAKIKGQNK